MQGATALAEGGRKFKVDVDLIFNNLKSTERKCILRTVFDDLGTWKAKYVEVNVSTRESLNHNKDMQSLTAKYGYFALTLPIQGISSQLFRLLRATITSALMYF